jgi:hypothetical protein
MITATIVGQQLQKNHQNPQQASNSREANNSMNAITGGAPTIAETPTTAGMPGILETQLGEQASTAVGKVAAAET